MASKSKAMAEVAKVASRTELLILLKEQDYKCALSGMQLTPDTATVDHIVPVSEGGSSDISNIQIVHSNVNRMKGAMSNDAFVELCSMIASNAASIELDRVPLGRG